MKLFWDWDIAAAGEAFRRATEVSPDYPTAHQWYSISLMISRQSAAALAEMKRAVELDPNSPAIRADLCQLYYFLEKYDDAIAQCKQTIDLNAGFFNAHVYLYDAYLANGMHREAVDEFATVESLKSDLVVPPTEIERLRSAFARSGIQEFWKLRIEWLKHKPSTYGLARYYARLGEKERSMEWLRRSHAERDFDFVYVFVDPVFKYVRKEPGFEALADAFYRKP